MKKISIAILALITVLSSCKKVPEVNLKYVDVERDLITVGTTTATIQCDYEYIATLKKAYFHYGEGSDTTKMTSAEMRVVQKTLYVELSDLKENTTYSYYYEFANGFNSMKSATRTFKTEGPSTTITMPTVVTAEVTEITSNSAKSGGEVTNDGGAEVTERGICWSTTANPTISDSHVAAGSGIGVFAATMSGLEANTTYHVRAYAINEKGISYGLDVEFTTLDDHEYVDLNLPSGTLWATCNVGATTPEDYGDYFAWGETTPKSLYILDTYQYCIGNSYYTLTKYCNDASCGYNGFTDDLTTLLPEDDAATANWGAEWRMPTYDEWIELYQNTSMIWTTQNGVNGRLFTASNGNSLFLPAAGLSNHGAQGTGESGHYWSSSLYTDAPYKAWDLYFFWVTCYVNYTERLLGFSVRPVRSSN